MQFDRRDFLKASVAFSSSTGLPPAASAQETFAPQPGAWRNFQIVTRLEIAKTEGTSQASVPVSTDNEKDWLKSLDTQWTTTSKAALKRDPKYGAEMVHVEWPEGETAPVIEVTSRFESRDWAIDLTKPGTVAPLSATERNFYTQGSELIPVDDIVRQTADKITAGKTSEVEKARAIYEWIVDNTFCDPKTRGCGIGDIVAMLTTGNLGGKCADLNALYIGLDIGLAMALGLPARNVIRVASSRFSYKGLGVSSDIITKAQHCRAKVYLTSFDWVPVDPADVRKVVLEEPPTNLAINDPKVIAARTALSGSCETNWLAYSFAHDLALPGSNGPKLRFLMYPQAETTSLRVDRLDPDAFKYTITSKELTVA